MADSKARFVRELEERFLRYARIDTQSNEKSPASPSTEKQLDLLNLLVSELKAIGAHEVKLTDYGAILATIPATVKQNVSTIAFLAHVDTAPAFNGTGVEPMVHRNYSGVDIVVSDQDKMVISSEKCPYLAEKIGDDIITASGTTLLGADDKAGVAIIMTAAEHLLKNPTFPTGPFESALPRMKRSAAAYTPIFPETCRPILHIRWTEPNWARLSMRHSPRTKRLSRSRESRFIPARPKTSW